LPIVKVRELLDAGMHYGHHVSRWNPKMAPYIFGRRNSIHIINLRETVRGLITACRFVTHVVAGGKMVVFVGTKRQARAAVREQAIRCGMPYVAERWLGGTLTNFRTIRSRLDRLIELESIVEGPAIQQYNKKEASRMMRELRKIKRNLDGIRTMEQIPGAVIIVDPKREKNAVAEAKRLNLPTICLADTDCDPDHADILVPGNDCAMRSVLLVTGRMADAVLAGKEKRREMARIEAEKAAAAAAVAQKEAAEKRAYEKKIAAAAKTAARPTPASEAARSRKAAHAAASAQPDTPAKPAPRPATESTLDKPAGPAGEEKQETGK